jgi:hypothetical protein
MSADRRERLIALIPRLWRWIEAADIFTELGRSRMAKVDRWLRRNGLTVPFGE